MKTFSLAAFVGCILAICLAVQFDEIEDVEQFNSDLKETGDLPFQLSKEEGKYVFDAKAQILDGNIIPDDYDEESANNDDDDDANVDGDNEVDEYINVYDQDVETKTNPAGQIKSLSDPRRRIRIRPRVMRQVRRFVRKPLMARRLRKSPQSGRKSQKGR